MPIVTFTNEVNLALELAFTIEDPAGIEAVELAHTILQIFKNREGLEAEAMHQSLLQWSLQWPRIEKSPDTERSQKGDNEMSTGFCNCVTTDSSEYPPNCHKPWCNRIPRHMRTVRPVETVKINGLYGKNDMLPPSNKE